MAIENTVSIDFDLRLSIVDSVFDCRLPGVVLLFSINFDHYNVNIRSVDKKFFNFEFGFERLKIIEAFLFQEIQFTVVLKCLLCLFF